MELHDVMVWSGLALWGAAQLLGYWLHRRRYTHGLRREYLRGYQDGLTKRRRRRP